MQIPTFVERAIDFSLAIAPRGASGSPQNVTLSGYRSQVSFSVQGNLLQARVNIAIYGLPLSLINTLTRIGIVNRETPNDAITITAGVKGQPLQTLYAGNILDAWADFDAMPDVVFMIQAQSMIYNAVKPIAPSSYTGSTSVASICANLASQMNLTLVNDGVNGTLSSPYFPGTAMDQLASVCRAANIVSKINGNTLTIYPLGSGLSLPPIPVSALNGMVGYPTLGSQGIIIKTLFNPQIETGRAVLVDSELTPAKGTWYVFLVNHEISAEMPEGPWYTRFMAQQIIKSKSA